MRQSPKKRENREPKFADRFDAVIRTSRDDMHQAVLNYRSNLSSAIETLKLETVKLH